MDDHAHRGSGQRAIPGQVVRRADRRRQFGRARHRRLRAALQPAERRAHGVHRRGEDLLRIDDELDADAARAPASPGMKCLPAGEVTASAGLPLQAATAARISASDCGELRNRMSAPSATNAFSRASASSNPREVRASVRASSRMPSSRHASTAARQRRMRGVALDHQLGAVMAERARPDLVLDQHRGGAARGHRRGSSSARRARCRSRCRHRPATAHSARRR